MPGCPDVVVLGAGVIGASVVHHLSLEGARVVLVDRERAGSGASGAAAGMLAPLAEADRPGPFLELALRSLKEFPPLAARLREETGVDPELLLGGLLRIAGTEAEAAELQERGRWQREAGHASRWLEAEEVRELEPGLPPDVRGALLTEEEGHVRSPRLVKALVRSALRHGTTLREGEAALSLVLEGERVAGVRTTSGVLPAGHVVLAAGAWSGLLAERMGLASLPVFPVRGQIAALRSPQNAPRRILLGGHGYIVPKADGTVIVGATQEEVGFDCRVTAAGMASMLDLVPRLAPALSDADFLGGWAGLRPGTSDGLPILGPAAGLQGLTVATGHFRNGVLLSPITGRLIAQGILSGHPDPTLAPFSPERLASEG